MPEKKLHIVSFDVPYPADYGGVIDVFYKLKALHACGWKIQLHCFMYGRKSAMELNKYCEKIIYYKRDISRAKLFLKLPYIVSSRNNKILIDNLLKDKAPVLFEGLHTTFPLNDETLKGRNCIVRAHNIEHEYYRQLGLVENNLFKKYYFNNEATKLEAYEPVLKKAKEIASISKEETKYFEKNYGKKAFYLPAFHPYEKINIKEGKGNYILYHANLSVAENHKAALFLVKEVMNDLKYEFIIAGNHANTQLKTAIKGNSKIKLIENPSNDEMDKLISEAQIHLLPAFQSTGVKLKLLAALFRGRHVIANLIMLKGTGLDELCEVADTAKQIKEKIQQLFILPLSEESKFKREQLLNKEFSNLKNAEMLSSHLKD